MSLFFMLAVKSKVLSLVIDMFVDANDCLSGEGAVTEEMARLQGRYAALGTFAVQERLREPLRQSETAFVRG
jgi:hypothetical protein